MVCLQMALSTWSDQNKNETIFCLFFDKFVDRHMKQQNVTN